MKAWNDMSDIEKMEHILQTPKGVVPCDEICKKCPIGTYKTCSDDVSYKRAKRWLEKNKTNKSISEEKMENFVDVELELDNDVISYLKKTAEERNITIDDLVNEILKEELAKYEKKIWKEDLVNGIDACIDNVSNNKVKYFIYDDMALSKPIAVLISIEEYNLLKEKTEK